MTSRSPQAQPPSSQGKKNPSLNRQILALALPAFGALIAEPLFVLGDTAIVGHLGSNQLAGLALGSNVVQTVVGLMVFLSYSTTPAVARAFGAGNLKEAFIAGRNGMAAGLLTGAVLAVVGAFTATPLLRALGAEGEILTQARTYLLPSLAGLPGMLLVLAAVGVLRGLQDTKTPLYVASLGAALNLGLSWLLVYPVGLGLAGSAIATAALQWAMGLTMAAMVLAGMKKHGVGLLPERKGLVSVFSLGSWLMLRNLAMRVALLLTVVVATRQGPENLAAYQLMSVYFSFLAFALDSLAIAAQALLGKEMGAADLTSQTGRAAVVRLKDSLVRWSLTFGVVTGALTPLVGFFGGWMFTSDARVQHLFALALLVVAVGQPLAAYVFVLDGVLIGAQDARYLGLASVVNLATYLPMLAAVHLIFRGEDAATAAFVWLVVSYVLGYMGARAITLGWRARQGVWIR